MSSWLQRLTGNRQSLMAVKDTYDRVLDNLRNFIPVAGDNRAEAQETESMLAMSKFFLDSALENMSRIRKK